MKRKFTIPWAPGPSGASSVGFVLGTWLASAAIALASADEAARILTESGVRCGLLW